MWWLLLVALLAALAFWALRPRAAAIEAEAPRYAKIRGSGRFDTQVVGESHYEVGLKRLLGTKAYTEEELFGDALLVLEDGNPHDPAAVAVQIQGEKVGHLSRKEARQFRAALVRDNIQGRAMYAVAARVYGGGPEGLFSVTLDLPQN